MLHHVWFHESTAPVGLCHGMLKPGFRHCLRAEPTLAGWRVRDFCLQGDITMDVPAVEYLERMRDNEYLHLRVLAIQLPPGGGPMGGFMSCAQVTAHGLGLGRRWPWTPYRLYRALLARGATHLFGGLA